jgi:hypothetical protein
MFNLRHTVLSPSRKNLDDSRPNIVKNIKFKENLTYFN